MKLDVSSLAHTKWECKYHIVFAPKYRRQIIYGKIKQDIGQMLRKLCEYKGKRRHCLPSVNSAALPLLLTMFLKMQFTCSRERC